MAGPDGRPAAATPRPPRHRPAARHRRHRRHRARQGRRHGRASLRRRRLPGGGRRPGHPARPAHLPRGPSRPRPVPPLAGALHAVRTPVLRRGPGHRHVHTVAWFRHPTDGGPSTSTPGPPPASRPSSVSGPTPAPPWPPSAPAASAATTRSWPRPTPCWRRSSAASHGTMRRRRQPRRGLPPAPHRSPGHSRCQSAGVPAGAHAPCAWWVCRHWYVTPSRVTTAPVS